MKILHVITSLHYAGAERLLVNAANLHAARHEIDIVYFKGEPHLEPELDPSITVHRVPLDKHCTKRLRQLMQERRPDVLHTHLGHADFAGLWASRGLPLKRVCTMHNIWFKWSWKDRIIFAIYRTLFRRVVPDCRVVCISQTVHQHVRRRLKVPADRALVIYNAIPHLRIDGTSADLRRELEIPTDAFCVLFVGRLQRQKSVETLIRAAARLRDQIPRLSVQIIGEGSEREALDALCRELDAEDLVRFRGVTRAPERYFAAADVFALPSVFEGFGLVVLEAFRAGLPVVATDIEGPAELIDHGHNGLLVPPRQDDQLAAALTSLHDDAALRQRLAEAGEQTFTERFSIERYAAQLEALYQN
ncbi:MAG: glycosyltransferase family 4 protein [Planctomycetota bacterium]